ncbi:peptidyl-prolyl cis-trans isomerase [Gracilibacillus sp. S3-1-1]|uniref:Peptidyl-prolyl cis-trans isomerase n=1 Tax=Gracilibacillus pellucidus TaxID=3095368 RepID=A0ACC6M9U3_9BACI|nr:peptidyl-prolyl cis-trans isomerase [Gracilibacillus sp. S3-1-1]MDX8047709.1 peptidyl-prolyl cis-trans isomerase [Gracilibacillus sp. S3-1-1]
MKTSRLVLWSIVILLLITNISTVIVFTGERNKSSLAILENKSVDPAEPLAKVNQKEINYQEWQHELVTRYGESVLYDLIDKEVVFQLAEQEGIEVHPKIVDRELARMMITKGILSDEEKQQKLEEWTDQINHRYYLQYLLSKDIAVSEQEIVDYYQMYKNQYQFQDMVQLSHIVVSTKPEAEYAIARLEGGESFQDVARELSIDDMRATDNGYLGYYAETSSFIPTEYYQVAISLTPGTYSEPIEVSGGYAIIFQHQHLPAITVSLEEAYEEVRQDIALSKLEQDVNASSLWERVDINIYKDNGLIE